MDCDLSRYTTTWRGSGRARGCGQSLSTPAHPSSFSRGGASTAQCGGASTVKKRYICRAGWNKPLWIDRAFCFLFLHFFGPERLILTLGAERRGGQTRGAARSRPEKGARCAASDRFTLMGACGASPSTTSLKHCAPWTDLK